MPVLERMFYEMNIEAGLQAKERTMTVSLHKIKASEKDILRNLMTLYLHELSEFADDLEPTAEGIFEYAGLDLYWKNESLIPFFVKVNGNLAGFILLNRHPYAPKDIDYNISEVFILKRYRSTEVAAEAVGKIFKSFPGKYNVGQLASNTRAVRFWRKVFTLNNITYEETEKVIDGFNCLMQRFTVE